MHEPLSLKHVLHVFRVTPKENGQLDHRLAGKLLVHGGNQSVLSDYYGLLGGFQNGPVNERLLEHMHSSPYFDVVNAQDLRDGLRADLLPQQDPPGAPVLGADEPGQENGTLPMPTQPPSVFEYSHPALTVPVVICAENGQYTFNGIPLSQLEMGRMVQNLKSGTATIRYRRSAREDAVAKMQTVFEDLVKIEPHLEAALAQLRGAVKAGHINPETFRSLSREIFCDHMVPGIGNKKAYEDFLSRPRQGVHIALDGNDFKSINDVHGHEAGDGAIKALFGAVRRAADSTVGRGQAKVYRTGGDEGRVWVPTHEHAAAFARQLRHELEQLPPIGGTHCLSMSLGFGHSPETADAASYRAKEAKKAAGLPKGQSKTHAYSAMPGFEGHIPLSPEQLPIAKPQEAFKPTTPEPAPAKAPEASTVPAMAAAAH